MKLEYKLLNKRIEIKKFCKKKPGPAEDICHKKIDRSWFRDTLGVSAIISFMGQGCKGSEQSGTAYTSDGSKKIDLNFYLLIASNISDLRIIPNISDLRIIQGSPEHSFVFLLLFSVNQYTGCDNGDKQDTGYNHT